MEYLSRIRYFVMSLKNSTKKDGLVDLSRFSGCLINITFIFALKSFKDEFLIID